MSVIKRQVRRSFGAIDFGKSPRAIAKLLHPYRRYLPTSLALGLGIGLSIAACSKTYQLLESYQLLELQQKLDRLATDLQTDFESNLDIVRTAVTLYATSEGEVKPSILEQFIQYPLYRHSGIEAIAWLPQNDARPATFTVATLFPQSAAAAIPGLESAVNSTVKSTLETAVARKEILATAPLSIQGQSDRQLRLLIVAPVYRPSSPHEAIEERDRTNLKGFVLGIFQIDSFLHLNLKKAELEAVDLSFQDLIEPKNRQLLGVYFAKSQQFITALEPDLFSSLGRPVSCFDGSACTRILNLQNRRWSVNLLLTSDYHNPRKYWQAWVALSIGILISGLTAFYLYKLLEHTESVEKIAKERTLKTQQLQEALAKLQDAQSLLIHAEKMSSLGILVAGLAHEINNPTNFIYGNLQYIARYAKDLVGLVELYRHYYPEPALEVIEYSEEIEFEFILEDMEKLSTSMQVGVERIMGIIQSLRQFSRLGDDRPKLANIQEGIEDTLTILQHRLRDKTNCFAIEVIKDYHTLPLVACYAEQLNQVFMNIIANAIDAIESDWQAEKSKDYFIKIQTRYLPGKQAVTVRIADNAAGIAEAIKTRLFEPFYTTKPVGKGTGLGLAISYQIVVERHGGALWCESTLGQGTEFLIELPVHSAIGRETPKRETHELTSETPVERLLENFWDGTGI
ncbi:CHASE domain-containing protein [Oscillatoria sp. FACHB-1406]|nr:CHASE domain-containing protein [Oscillatoria sp. FACHB-1406]